MGRKDSRDYLVLIAVVKEIHRHMATVAVKDQEAVLSSCFGLSEAVEDLFEPSKACLVVSPASRRRRDKYRVSPWLNFLYLA